MQMSTQMEDMRRARCVGRDAELPCPSQHPHVSTRLEAL